MSKTHFNPTAKKKALPLSKNIAIHFSDQAERQRIELLADAANVTVSYFCLEAVRYAVSEMEEQR